MSQRYTAYKPSGVEWISQVPTHWEVIRIKYMVSKVGSGVTPKGGAEVYQHDGIPLLRSQNIYFDGLRMNDVAYITEEVHQSMAGSAVMAGDVLLNITGASIGRCFYVPDDLGEANVNQHVCILRRNERVTTKYLYYLLASSTGQNQIDRLQTGANREGLNFEQLRNFVFPLPDKTEQKILTDYLAKHTSRIDETIRKKQRLIELLQEEGTALIDHVVTSGLNPCLPLKYSGVEWLGMIPTHWSNIALKHLVEVPITDGPHETPTFYPDGVPFVSAEAVKNGSIDFDSVRGYIDEETDIRYSTKCKPRRGDVFVVKSGSTTGKVAIVETDRGFNIWSPIALVRPSEKVLSRFLFYALCARSFQTQVQLYWSFGTQPNIGMGVLENLSICDVPREEQSEIVQYLDARIGRIQETIDHVAKEIDLLQEYRTVLINEVVTGKICVLSEEELEKRIKDQELVS